MKKYFIAGVVAISVFAMSAFAASLTVNGGVVQAGVDDTLTCANSVDATWITSNDAAGSWVKGVELTFDTTGCDGIHPQLHLYNGNTQMHWLIGADPVVGNSVAVNFATAGTYPAGTLGPADGTVRTEDLTEVQIVVKTPLDATEQSIVDFLVPPAP